MASDSDGEDDLLFGMDPVENNIFPLIPGSNSVVFQLVGHLSVQVFSENDL